jgi:polyferredoxin
MSWLKKSIAVVFTATVTAAFFNVPLSGWAPKFQATASALSFFDAFAAGGFSLLKCTAFIVVLALTLLFGRFYCEVMCPLGVVQSFVDWLFRRRRAVRRVCTRLPESRAQRIVRWSVVALAAVLCVAGLWPLAWIFDPYAIYGRMIAFTLPFAFIGVAIIVLAACGRARIWCNWVCPVGTVLSFVSRFAWRQDKVKKCAGCDRCGRCFAPAKDTAGTGKEARA